MKHEVLSTRQLNRALLARQHLLERRDAPLTQVIDELGGLQTQYAPSGYISLWSRMNGFQRADLTRAMEAREAIHGTLMRVTIHTVSATDYWPMAIAVRQARREWFASAWRRVARSVDMEAAAAAGREILSGTTLRVAELKRRMAERGFEGNGWALWVDLVRVPPSGTWERRMNDLYALADEWLPPEFVHPDGLPTEDDGLRLMLRRYLTAFGPARPTDFAEWAGIRMRRAQPIIDSCELRRFSDELGHELIDLPGLPLPDPKTPAPVRFLPPFDPTTLVSCRRTQILPDDLRPRIFTRSTPWSVGMFLVDGRICGTWHHEAGRVTTDALVELTADARREVAEEAARLAEFHADGDC